jgi:hypothetical protein
MTETVSVWEKCRIRVRKRCLPELMILVVIHQLLRDLGRDEESVKFEL